MTSQWLQNPPPVSQKKGVPLPSAGGDEPVDKLGGRETQRGRGIERQISGAELFLEATAILKVREAWCRTQALTRCLRIANAMWQKDVWKDNEIKLADLGLPTATIVDPYDDSSIKLTKIKGEWVIYSVGNNLKDDGGNLESYLDVGLGPIPAGRRDAARKGERRGVSPTCRQVG